MAISAERAHTADAFQPAEFRTTPTLAKTPLAGNSFKETAGLVALEPQAASWVNAPAVAAGSAVRLWRNDSIVHLELRAIALGSGSTGSTIKVRLANNGAVLEGVVRGSGSVEMRAAANGYSERSR